MSIPSEENPLFKIKDCYVTHTLGNNNSGDMALVLIDVYKTAAKVWVTTEKFQRSKAEEIKDQGELESLVVKSSGVSLERNEDLSEAESEKYYTVDGDRPVFTKVKNLTYTLSTSMNRTDLVGITLRGVVQGLMRSHFPNVPDNEIRIPLENASQKA